MVRRTLLMILLPALLAGCGLKHEPYQSDREIPEGPGMLSGEDGGLTYSGDPLGLKDEEPKDEAQAGGETAPGASKTGTGEFSDYQEFLQYQEFQRWKETAQGTAEYREFQDWREWKEYRRWQRQKSQ